MKNKVLPFTIPKSDQAAILVQKEREQVFYGHLHEHPETQLSLILSGQGTLFCANSVLPFKAGSLVCIFGGQPHLFRSDPDCEVLSERISIFFLNSWLAQIANLTPEIKAIHAVVSAHKSGWILPEAGPELIDHFKKMPSLNAISRFKGFFSLLELIPTASCKNLGDVTALKNYSRDDSDRMSRIIEYTMNHYQEAIVIRNVADKIALTPTAFCKYFKKRTGKTYVTFLNELRCEAARNVLSQNRELSMSEVAEVSGFNSIANFNRQFKKHMKTPPRAYRKLKADQTAGELF